MKQKTHKGLAKRVKVGKKGAVKAHKGGARHLKSNKSGKQARQLRKSTLVKGKTAAKIRIALGR
jgi:large subunit ribosomal protein L35